MSSTRAVLAVEQVTSLRCFRKITGSNLGLRPEIPSEVYWVFTVLAGKNQDATSNYVITTVSFHILSSYFFTNQPTVRSV
jgi:hypothetical protein